MMAALWKYASVGSQMGDRMNPNYRRTWALLMVASVVLTGCQGRSGPAPTTGSAGAGVAQVRWYSWHEFQRPVATPPPQELRLIRFTDAGTLMATQEGLEVWGVGVWPQKEPKLAILSIYDRNRLVCLTRAVDLATRQTRWEVSLPYLPGNLVGLPGMPLGSLGEGGLIVVPAGQKGGPNVVRLNPTTGTRESLLVLPEGRMPLNLLGTLSDGQLVEVSFPKDDPTYDAFADQRVHVGRPGQAPDFEVVPSSWPQVKGQKLLLPTAISKSGLLLTIGLADDKATTLFAFDLVKRAVLWKAEYPGVFMAVRVEDQRVSMQPWTERSALQPLIPPTLGESVFVHDLASGRLVYALQPVFPPDELSNIVQFLGHARGVDVYLQKGVFGVDAQTGRRLWQTTADTEPLRDIVSWVDEKTGEITLTSMACEGIRLDARTGRQIGIVHFEAQQGERNNNWQMLLRAGDLWLIRTDAHAFREKVEPLTVEVEIPEVAYGISEEPGKAVPILLKNLHKRRVEFRRAAMKGFDRIIDAGLANDADKDPEATWWPQVVAALRQATHDEDSQVRQMAAELLRSIQSRPTTQGAR